MWLGMSRILSRQVGHGRDFRMKARRPGQVVRVVPLPQVTAQKHHPAKKLCKQPQHPQPIERASRVSSQILNLLGINDFGKRTGSTKSTRSTENQGLGRLNGANSHLNGTRFSGTLGVLPGLPSAKRPSLQPTAEHRLHRALLQTVPPGLVVKVWLRDVSPWPTTPGGSPERPDRACTGASCWPRRKNWSRCWWGNWTTKRLRGEQARRIQGCRPGRGRRADSPRDGGGEG